MYQIMPYIITVESIELWGFIFIDCQIFTFLSDIIIWVVWVLLGLF